jgi:predicted phosphate transport protein (TIGR00153 family)
MRIPFASLFVSSPFAGLQEHAEKVKECAWSFQQAIECHISDRCPQFEALRSEVSTLEHQADSIKRRIRGHLPVGTLMPVSKFQLFRYLREQDHVLDAVKDTLNWISYREDPGIPEALHKDVLLLVDAVIEPLEELSRMVSGAKRYFETYSEAQRVAVKEIIRKVRAHEHAADKIEAEIKHKVFNMATDPVTVFHMVRLAEIIGSIADHAENAGDMMRAMLAR